MTRGQDGSLLLSCMTLSFTTHCRFSPALQTIVLCGLPTFARVGRRRNRSSAAPAGARKYAGKSGPWCMLSRNGDPRYATATAARLEQRHQRASCVKLGWIGPGLAATGKAVTHGCTAKWLGLHGRRGDRGAGSATLGARRGDLPSGARTTAGKPGCAARSNLRRRCRTARGSSVFIGQRRRRARRIRRREGAARVSESGGR
jgi:hypothetical protein